jgi:hypothetical protein
VTTTIKELPSMVYVLTVIVLVLLAIFLFQRIR